ncbi:membrane transport protein-domain-containing protein [Podospora fimiseda]|uniref:Membrane transport protein-domain-containing protein n=1 Tax=Podospora fimiseda TaxID=252190 RepID=A0AAN6YN01_9PEZI|nr:membrane transport protein-domain-containing protein [Podospora fimiseda]
MLPSGLLEAFLGAIQASLSVLLVISYGAFASWMNLLDRKATKSISKVCVRLFLPALIITKVGSELHPSSASNYFVIVIWGIICHVISFAIGTLGHRGFGMPDWTTVAILINNTTSYPLLLITALEETGILSSLIVKDESTKDAVERAKSYFLVFSTISNLVTFGIGPRLIDTENGPDEEDKGDNSDDDHSPSSTPDREADEESHLLMHNQHHPGAPRAPKYRRAALIPEKTWDKLGSRGQWWLEFLSDFCNPPLLGALIGTIIGLTPFLHRAFFKPSSDGGIFTAWLTQSLKNIGNLFVSLPVLVAGFSLFDLTMEARKSSDISVRLPWLTVLFILVVRFIIWPIASIASIYFLASWTGLLGSDPILWFTLMLMPCGPSAMKLISLIQVSDVSKDDEAKMARLLTISYIISPLLSVTVVGSLIASRAAIPA